MSAVMQSKPVELRLSAAPEMPRKLTVELSAGGFVYVYLYPANSNQSLAHAMSRLEDAALYSKWPALIVGDAHFKLTASEAVEIERALGPSRLRIDTRGLRS